MEVIIKYEINKRSYLKEYKYFLDYGDFLKKYVRKKIKEGYELIGFLKETYLILKKDYEVIRCYF